MSGTTPALSDLFYDPTYSPGKSMIDYTSIYGNGTTITFDELQGLVNSTVTQAIMFGVRCGAAALTLIVMWMISRSRKTPIFIINQVSLFLIILHSALYFKYLLSNYSSVTYALTGFPQFISRGDVHVYGATNIIQVLLVASIETSLVFQIKVIFTGDNFKRIGFMLTSTSFILGLATVIMYFVSAVKGMIATYQDVSATQDKYFNASTILLASSINFMSFVLVVKLILAIRSRRFLGLKQFDSFHILLVMSCQSLLVPSVIFILAYSLKPGQGTDVLTTVATLLAVLSLPLSSMWATAANNASKPNTITSDFTTSSDRFYPCGPSSFQSDSMSNDAKSSCRSRLYDLYPKKKESISDKHSERTFVGDTTNDIEKNQFYQLPTPTSSKITRTGPFADTSNKEEDSEVTNMYTPDTAADEEARRFWTEDDKNL
ncbi:ste2p [Saccharomyces arboricola H-6]|uniref:Ste2p n=1 Tax=Saccharomyces arboricola (strain H-6 / AS 2.3317 / CBS 10644) TaxID=1160507 RepID=J8Q5L6_SACAR|nr:ste2p [Saccharomyces arboricola H-6]